MSFQTTVTFPSALVVHMLVEEYDDADIAMQKDAKAKKQDTPAISAVASYTKTVDLAQVMHLSDLPAVALAALQFGVKTRLSNAARTVATKDISDSESAVDGVIEAWMNGEWGAERESSAIPFNAKGVLSCAVSAAFPAKFASSDAAASYLCAAAEKLAQANGVASFASADDKTRAKIRRDVEKKARETVAVERAFLAEEKKRNDDRHARRMAAIGAKAEDDDGGMFA